MVSKINAVKEKEKGKAHISNKIIFFF